MPNPVANKLTKVARKYTVIELQNARKYCKATVPSTQYQIILTVPVQIGQKAECFKD
jgi:hypothetical protein